MAQMADLIINDGQTTPVAQTFSPASHDATTYVWRQSTNVASILGAAVFSLAKLRVKGNGGLEKYRVRMFIPVLEVVTGNNSLGYSAAPRLAYSMSSINDFTIPSRAPIPQRKDLLALSRGIIQSIAGHPAYEAIVNGFMPN